MLYIDSLSVDNNLVLLHLWQWEIVIKPAICSVTFWTDLFLLAVFNQVPNFIVCKAFINYFVRWIQSLTAFYWLLMANPLGNISVLSEINFFNSYTSM